MTDELGAVVFANHGRWKARCPRPYCSGAEHFGADSKSGHVGGLNADVFSCAECGLTVRAVWPVQRLRIERLLMQRPAPATRNWEPGETLADLFAENLEHGLVTLPAIEDAPNGAVFQIVGDQVGLDPAGIAAGGSPFAIGKG